MNTTPLGTLEATTTTGDAAGEQSHVESTRIPLDRLNWAAWRRVVLNVMRSEVGGRVKLLFARCSPCCSRSTA